MYREKEEEFSNSFKRNNKIWAEIAAEMNKVNPTYKITVQQCTSKMFGLKRTYKNIVDMNKKSGNNRNSWAFFRYVLHIYTYIYIDNSFIIYNIHKYATRYICISFNYSYHVLGYGFIIWRQSVH